ncbi:MAG: N-acetylmuramidase domain-containing protein, partial [Nitratireductor sp.]
RFEGHYFYRLLPKAKRNIGVTQGLAHAKAGYIKNSRFQTMRWRHLNKCIALDRDAALQSTSWGVGQVMGVHWRWLGYASIDDMVARARAGIAGQCELMVRFIKKSKIDKYIENEDWAAFARAYNGAGYRQNKYDTKLAKAYAKYRILENTNVRQLVKQKRDNRNSQYQLKLGSYGEAVVALQRDLRACGFVIEVDGDFGPITRRAVIAFQKANGLVLDGIVGPKTFEMMARYFPQPANLLKF